MSENKEIIRVEKLRREFMVGGEKVKALRGVSFTIREGEFVTTMALPVPENPLCSIFSAALTPRPQENMSSTEPPYSR